MPENACSSWSKMLLGACMTVTQRCLSLVIRNINTVKYRVHLAVWKTIKKNPNNWSKLVYLGPRKAVAGYKITPNRFKTTYRSVLTFEEKTQSITHLFKTFFRASLGCNALILAKRSENTFSWTFQNQRHFQCEIPRELFSAKGQRSGSDVTNRQATKRGSRVCVSVHRATDLYKFPVRISRDEAPFQ